VNSPIKGSVNLLGLLDVTIVVGLNVVEVVVASVVFRVVFLFLEVELITVDNLV